MITAMKLQRKLWAKQATESQITKVHCEELFCVVLLLCDPGDSVVGVISDVAHVYRVKLL